MIVEIHIEDERHILDTNVTDLAYLQKIFYRDELDLLLAAAHLGNLSQLGALAKEVYVHRDGLSMDLVEQDRKDWVADQIIMAVAKLEDAKIIRV